MKQLAQKPLFLSLLLAIILWFVFDNFVVAASVGLLSGFMVSMLHSLHVLKTQKDVDNTQRPEVREPVSAPDNTAPENPQPTPDTGPPIQKPMTANTLPVPDSVALAHTERVSQSLLQQLQETFDGFMPFEHWMQHALYSPGMGYYAAGSEKLGSDIGNSDFTTAPELSPLFGQTLANQVAQILQACGARTVLEFGAGSGALAAALIPALKALGIDPVYQILEVSADLKARQQARLSAPGIEVQWLNQLPRAFEGCIIANEVLDAMPVTVFEWQPNGQLAEVGVVHTGTFEMATRPASPRLQKIAADRMPALPGYRSELNLNAEAWVTGLGDWLHRGAALLIDYGFPRREYYHPQRAEGTLMCHYRHHSHANPLLYPGLQDITAHVDFTAMADAALAGGLDVLGYTSQARFLINCGLAERVAQLDTSDPVKHAQQTGAIQKLLSEAEMGELFKVLAVGQGIDVPLKGFSQGDRRDRL